MGRKESKQTTESISSLHIPIQLCFLFLKENFRKRGMLFDETCIELLDFDIFLEMFCNDKNGHFFQLPTQILESVDGPWQNITVCGR